MDITCVLYSMSLRDWLKEPLLHFLAVGGVLFLAASWIWPAPEAGRVITIGRAEMLDHLQSRAQLYDQESFSALLDNMSEEERRQLLRDTAVSEALYREGEALGMSDADPIVRARVIRQMRLLLMEEAAQDVALTQEDVQAFFEANQARYQQGARASFTHIFYSNESRGEAAESDARSALERAMRNNLPIADAGREGDRFLYQRNYAAVSNAELLGQFGEEFASSLLALEASRQWTGPLQSQHGWHVVAVTAMQPARVPAFEEIAGRVAEDAASEQRSRGALAAIDELMQNYEIRSEDGITN